MKLITSLYDEANVLRRLEYRACLIENAKIFNEIHVLYERESGSFEEFFHELEGICILVVHEIRFRPHFSELFDVARAAGGVCCISNADIYFDQSIHYLKERMSPEKFFVLTRQDVLGGGRLIRTGFGTPNIYSADAWIFDASSLRSIQSDFAIGSLGCDSYLNYYISKAGYTISNPCREVRAHHLHNESFNSSDSKLEKDAEEYYEDQQRRSAANDGITPIAGVAWSFCDDVLPVGHVQHVVPHSSVQVRLIFSSFSYDFITAKVSAGVKCFIECIEPKPQVWALKSARKLTKKDFQELAKIGSKLYPPGVLVGEALHDDCNTEIDFIDIKLVCPNESDHSGFLRGQLESHSDCIKAERGVFKTRGNKTVINIRCN